MASRFFFPTVEGYRCQTAKFENVDVSFNDVGLNLKLVDHHAPAMQVPWTGIISIKKYYDGKRHIRILVSQETAKSLLLFDLFGEGQKIHLFGIQKDQFIGALMAVNLIKQTSETGNTVTYDSVDYQAEDKKTFWKRILAKIA